MFSKCCCKTRLQVQKTLVIVSCIPGLSIKSCHAPAPVFSSCHHLLGSSVKRTLVSLLAVMSLVGNSASLLLRHCCRKTREKASNDVTELFVSHLSVSNCVMGVYLAVLAVADQLQSGDYLWRDQVWRSSPWCVVCGFLFLVSSQVSVFIVTIATVGRCWVLSRPHGDAKTKKVSILLCLVSWITGFVLASVPDAWTSFSSSGACIPSLVPLWGQDEHHYVTGLLIVLNGVLMILTSVGQGFIYTAVGRSEVDLILGREGSRDLTLALRIMTISITDAVSWFAITLLTLLTSHGILTSMDVSFTCTMVTMVTKPSINPYLYFLGVVGERRRQTLQQRLLQWLRKKDLPDKFSS